MGSWVGRTKGVPTASFNAVFGMPDSTRDSEAVMALSARISADKLAAKVGKMIDVIIDAVDPETGGATGRSQADAPEIDGEVHLRDAGALATGDIVRVVVEDSDEHDLFGALA